MVLAGALLLIGVTPWLLSAGQTLSHDLAPPPNIANRAAPVDPGLTVYDITNTKATGDTLVALSASAGTIRWSRVFTGGVVTIMARGLADVIVGVDKMGAKKGDIMALRASDGSTLWQRELDGGISLRNLPSTPLALDATGAASSPLYVATSEISQSSLQPLTGFTALRASDGAVLWQDTAPASRPIRYSNPLVTPRTILFESSLYQLDGVAGDMEFLAADATTGQTTWVTMIHQGPNAVQRDFVAGTSAAYITTYDTARQRQEIEALRLTDGKVLWRADVDPTNGMLGLTGSGGVLAWTQTQVIALNVASGKTLWTVGRNASASADVTLQAAGDEPVVHANTMYFTAEVGNTYPQQPMVYAVDTASGKLRWTYHLPTSVGVALQWKNDKVYILDGENGVTALDAATGAVRWRLTESSGVWNPDWTVGGLGNSDWTVAPDTVWLGLSIDTPPRPGDICAGGVMYPFVWALSSEDGAVYWRTLIAEGHAFGSSACA